MMHWEWRKKREIVREKAGACVSARACVCKLCECVCVCLFSHARMGEREKE